MSKHWKENLDPQVHRDFMISYDIGGVPVRRRNNIKQEWVYFVKECSFTFQFRNLAQLAEMIAYFSVKVHPSTRKPHNGLEYYWQSWQERLPSGLLGGAKRIKILAALVKAQEEWQKT